MSRFNTRFYINKSKRTEWPTVYYQDSQSLSHTQPQSRGLPSSQSFRFENVVQNHLLSHRWMSPTPPLPPRCTPQLSHSKDHRHYPFAPRQLLHHAGPPVPHRATSNDSVCPSPGATRTPLTDTIWQEARSSRGGLEATGTSQRKEWQRRRKRLRTAWLSAERDVKFTGTIWTDSPVGLQQQPCLISCSPLTLCARGPNFYRSDKSHKLWDCLLQQHSDMCVWVCLCVCCSLRATSWLGRIAVSFKGLYLRQGDKKNNSEHSTGLHSLFTLSHISEVLREACWEATPSEVIDKLCSNSSNLHDLLPPLRNQHKLEFETKTHRLKKPASFTRATGTGV